VAALALPVGQLLTGAGWYKPGQLALLVRCDDSGSDDAASPSSTGRLLLVPTSGLPFRSVSGADAHVGADFLHVRSPMARARRHHCSCVGVNSVSVAAPGVASHFCAHRRSGADACFPTCFCVTALTAEFPGSLLIVREGAIQGHGLFLPVRLAHASRSSVRP
jgi:hypothetical protein